MPCAVQHGSPAVSEMHAGRKAVFFDPAHTAEAIRPLRNGRRFAAIVRRRFSPLGECSGARLPLRPLSTTACAGA